MTIKISNMGFLRSRKPNPASILSKFQFLAENNLSNNVKVIWDNKNEDIESIIKN